MIILGINAYHPDSSACLLVDGKIKIAIEEERINRVKHWAGFPILSIKKCLEEQKILLSDINFIAINNNSLSNLYNKLKYIITNRPYFNFYLQRFKNLNKKKNILQILNDNFGGLNNHCKLINIDHHLSHLASAYYDSPFENSVNLSVDAFGNFSSVSWGLARNNVLKIDERILFPHSLGIFYEAFTQFLGFHNFGDEYKVMGLSSYGKPTENHKLKNIINLKKKGKFELNIKYFNHHKDEASYSWNNTSPKTSILFNKNIEKLFGPPIIGEKILEDFHKNIACSVQNQYEEALFHMLNYIYDKYKISNLTLSGGCAQNSLANGKIIKNTKFSSIFVPSNPGDAGGAIGAAYVAWFNLKKERPKRNLTAYLGTNYKNDEVKNFIYLNEDILSKKKCSFLEYKDEKELLKFISEEIAKEKVVGWFQGKMEWGPRALGNRSIIADPRKKNIKDIINLKIKRRESFRPFAPSIILEEVNNWFDNFHEEELFMSKVVKFKDHKKDLVAGVVHIDGTGRLQTVKYSDNPRFYNLIKSFYNLTGVPILLNTSFNENEPIVFTLDNALQCFLRTEMDILVIENWVIHR
jgi:carbamoyltransferase